MKKKLPVAVVYVNPQAPIDTRESYVTCRNPPRRAFARSIDLQTRVGQLTRELPVVNPIGITFALFCVLGNFIRYNYLKNQRHAIAARTSLAFIARVNCLCLWRFSRSVLLISVSRSLPMRCKELTGSLALTCASSLPVASFSRPHPRAASFVRLRGAERRTYERESRVRGIAARRSIHFIMRGQRESSTDGMQTRSRGFFWPPRSHESERERALTLWRHSPCGGRLVAELVPRDDGRDYPADAGRRGTRQNEGRGRKKGNGGKREKNRPAIPGPRCSSVSERTGCVKDRKIDEDCIS